MADLSEVLVFHGKCPDCGTRKITLPDPLPEVGDDFDWGARDYDGIRVAMLQDLAARFPERRRFTPADLEVVLVETLAGALDQLSDQIDRVTAEAYLETARRPSSVRRLLSMIGYDSARYDLDAIGAASDDSEAELVRKLEEYWTGNPHAMNAARLAGPRAIHDQLRMVTLEDYSDRLEEHPLVERAHAWTEWTGSWHTIRVAVIGVDNRVLDDNDVDYGDELRIQVKDFHDVRDLFLPGWVPIPSIRTILRSFVDRYRMLGQEVVLEDAIPVPISMSLSVIVASNYFQSEVRHAIGDVLSTRPGGFFEPGRLQFGEDLHASDIFQALMALDGVENVCLNRFKRIGSQYPDQSDSGIIRLDGLEVAVCDNDPENDKRGYWRLVLHGGKKG